MIHQPREEEEEGEEEEDKVRRIPRQEESGSRRDVDGKEKREEETDRREREREATDRGGGTDRCTGRADVRAEVRKIQRENQCDVSSHEHAPPPCDAHAAGEVGGRARAPLQLRAAGENNRI